MGTLTVLCCVQFAQASNVTAFPKNADEANAIYPPGVYEIMKTATLVRLAESPGSALITPLPGHTKSLSKNNKVTVTQCAVDETYGRKRIAAKIVAPCGEGWIIVNVATPDNLRLGKRFEYIAPHHNFSPEDPTVD